MKTRLGKLLRNERAQIIVVGAFTSLCLALLYFFNPALLRPLDAKFYDHLLRARPAAAGTGVPVIVDIDEKSLSILGQWPWPRYRLSMLLSRIHKSGALAIGLDFMLAEPDRTSPELIIRQFRSELGLDIGFRGLPDTLQDHDALLAETLRATPSALGFYFSFSNAEGDQQRQVGACLIKPANVALLAAPDARSAGQSLHMAFGPVCPLPRLAAAAQATGYFNAVPDPDGIMRRVPLLINYNGEQYPALALSTLMIAAGDQNLLLELGRWGVKSLRFAGEPIPVDRNGQLLLNFRGGAGSFPYYSAVDVLSGKIGQEALAGKIVFIGTSAAGLKDMRTTPLSALYPGVEVHATIVDNILAQDFLSVPDYAPAIELGTILLAGIGLAVLLAWVRPVLIALPLLCMCTGMWLGAQHLLEHQRIFISPLYGLIILVLNFGLLTLLKFWREENQRRFIHGAFSHYLAPAVIKQIYESPDALSLKGQEREVSILFSDVRSFASLSENLSPTQVTDLLHDYLTPMTRIITGSMGTVDKFIGDAIMAFWNAPIDVPNHQKAAVESALRMHEQLEGLNKGFAARFGLTIRIGVGVHFGSVRVGNMGSDDLFDYTLIGDNVNVASRMESLTKYYGLPTIVSQSIVDACPDDYLFLELDTVRVVGKHESLIIHTVLRKEHGVGREAQMERHKRALALYKQQRFLEAQGNFRALAATPGWEKFYGLYVERCQKLIDETPGPDWDAVHTHTSK